MEAEFYEREWGLGFFVVAGDLVFDFSPDGRLLYSYHRSRIALKNHKRAEDYVIENFLYEIMMRQVRDYEKWKPYNDSCIRPA